MRTYFYIALLECKPLDCVNQQLCVSVKDVTIYEHIDIVRLIIANRIILRTSMHLYGDLLFMLLRLPSLFPKRLLFIADILKHS